MLTFLVQAVNSAMGPLLTMVPSSAEQVIPSAGGASPVRTASENLPVFRPSFWLPYEDTSGDLQRAGLLAIMLVNADL